MLEIEVKIRLLSKASHGKVFQLLKESGKHLRTEFQHNHFFDSLNGELSSQKIAFRLRRSRKVDALTQTETEKAVFTMKGGGALKDGISRKEELESDVPVHLVDRLVADPTLLSGTDLSQDSVVSTVLKSVPPSPVWKQIGSFSNRREVIEWNGFEVELDETEYTFGTAWEIEIETSNPETAKSLMEDFLKRNGITDFKDSKRGKLANMKRGSIE